MELKVMGVFLCYHPVWQGGFQFYVRAKTLPLFP